MTQAMQLRQMDAIKQLQIFLEKIACENVSAFCDKLGELRLGLNAAWALDSLTSHLSEASSEKVKLDCNTDATFKRKRAENDKDFFLVWEVSTATKHGIAQRTKFVNSSQEIQKVRVDGALAYFSHVEPERWGDRLMLANEDFGLFPFDRAVRDTFRKMEADCKTIIYGVNF